MNTDGIITEGMFEKIFKYLLQGRMRKVEKILGNNPYLKKATKDTQKALDNYKKTLKKYGNLKPREDW